MFSLTDTNDSRDNRGGRGSHYFSCFLFPSAHEHSYSSSRFLPVLFSRSICNYQTDSWWDMFFPRDLHFTCIFIDAIKSELLTLTFQSDIVRIWAHTKLSTLLFQSKGLNRLRLAPLATTVYLSHLPSPTPIHQLSSIHLPKCIRNKECFIFSEIGTKITKIIFSVEIENGNLIYINIKRVSQMDIDYTRC